MKLSPSSKASLRLVAGLLLIGGLFWASRRFALPDCETLRGYTKGNVALSAFLFFLGVTVATLLLVPGAVLGGMGGMLFGPFWGTLLVALSCTMGAVLAYGIGRLFAHDAVLRWLEDKSWYRHFRDAPDHHQWSYLFFLRLSPVFPFHGVNYGCALLRVPLVPYAVTALIGMIPGTFAYVYAGHAVGCLALQGNLLALPAFRKQLLIAAALLGGVSLLPLLIRRRDP